MDVAQQEVMVVASVAWEDALCLSSEGEEVEAHSVDVVASADVDVDQHLPEYRLSGRSHGHG